MLSLEARIKVLELLGATSYLAERRGAFPRPCAAARACTRCKAPASHGAHLKRWMLVQIVPCDWALVFRP